VTTLWLWLLRRWWVRRRVIARACPIFPDGHRWYHGRCAGCDRPAGATR
jgi:hypothetical protein